MSLLHALKPSSIARSLRWKPARLTGVMLGAILAVNVAAVLWRLLSAAAAGSEGPDINLDVLVPGLVSVTLAVTLLIVWRRERRRAETETASQTRDEFVSTISHELRTPLQSILGRTQLILRDIEGRSEVPAAALRVSIATIERNARALATTIDDLLDASPSAGGRGEAMREPVSLTAAVRAAADAARPLALAKQVELTVELAADDLQVVGDAARLRQVAGNLIGNAVKFTPPGGTVSVRLAGADGRVQLRVRDNGIGITPQMLPRVFDRYVQGSVSTSRQFGGLGLGLAIVKQLVERHGGTVEALSAGSGQGAEFVVTFAAAGAAAMSPKHPASEPAAGRGSEPQRVLPARSAPAGGRLAALRVLVVDDDADVRAVLASLLGDEGAEVHTAASAEEGFDKLRRLHMDIIVSDIGMPNADGYVLARAVRGFGNAFSATPTTTPMIALTAFSRVEDQRRALDSGFDLHLGKPVELDRLIAVVAAQAQQHAGLQRAPSKVLPLAPPSRS